MFLLKAKHLKRGQILKTKFKGNQLDQKRLMLKMLACYVHKNEKLHYKDAIKSKKEKLCSSQEKEYSKYLILKRHIIILIKASF